MAVASNCACMRVCARYQPPNMFCRDGTTRRVGVCCRHSAVWRLSLLIFVAVLCLKKLLKCEKVRDKQKYIHINMYLCRCVCTFATIFMYVNIHICICSVQNELKITLSGFGTYNCGSRAVVLHATNFVIIEFSSQLRETTTFMGESNHQHRVFERKN